LVFHAPTVTNPFCDTLSSHDHDVLLTSTHGFGSSATVTSAANVSIPKPGNLGH
jgi:hypothetical protein